MQEQGVVGQGSAGWCSRSRVYPGTPGTPSTPRVHHPGCPGPLLDHPVWATLTRSWTTLSGQPGPLPAPGTPPGPATRSWDTTWARFLPPRPTRARLLPPRPTRARLYPREEESLVLLYPREEESLVILTLAGYPDPGCPTTSGSDRAQASKSDKSGLK